MATDYKRSEFKKKIVYTFYTCTYILAFVIGTDSKHKKLLYIHKTVSEYNE